jgi:hypothetical protein
MNCFSCRVHDILRHSCFWRQKVGIGAGAIDEFSLLPVSNSSHTQQHTRISLLMLLFVLLALVALVQCRPSYVPPTPAPTPPPWLPSKSAAPSCLHWVSTLPPIINTMNAENLDADSSHILPFHYAFAKFLLSESLQILLYRSSCVCIRGNGNSVCFLRTLGVDCHLQWRYFYDVYAACCESE